MNAADPGIAFVARATSLLEAAEDLLAQWQTLAWDMAAEAAAAGAMTSRPLADLPEWLAESVRDVLQCSTPEVRGRIRSRRIDDARLAIALCLHRRCWTLDQIGAVLDRHGKSTVRRAIASAERRAIRDRDFARRVGVLRADIDQRYP